MATTFFVFLSAAVFAAAAADATPLNCPSGIEKFDPKDGDLLIQSPANTLQRYRSGHDAVQQPIILKPDRNISFYYVTTPESLTTPMVFALIRAYKMQANRATSLRPNEVRIANSKSRGQQVSIDDYKFFHAEKRRQPSVLRTVFHMRFADGRFPWDNWDNSYDEVSNPDVYDLPKGDGYSGFKAYMQRITGFSEGGRCVVFRLFNRADFAAAVDTVSLVLVALADKREAPNDTTSFSITFSAPH